MDAPNPLLNPHREHIDDRHEPPAGALTPPLAPRRACLRSIRPSRSPLAGIGRAGCWPSSGPGYLVSVGYMDPGNWATDLAGGSKFGYTLLSVILLSNLMAILLQALAARLGIVTDRDLAQACRATYSRPVNFLLWLACEAAIIACDLAEVDRHRDRARSCCSAFP